MKKIIAILLSILCVACLLCGCGSENLELKEFVKKHYEIDAETEAEMIETVSELKQIAKEAETTKDKLNFAESITKFHSEFNDSFKEKIEMGNEKLLKETNNDLKEKYIAFNADYGSVSLKALIMYSSYVSGEIDEEEYFEMAVDYLNEYAKVFFIGFEDKDLID